MRQLLPKVGEVQGRRLRGEALPFLREARRNHVHKTAVSGLLEEEGGEVNFLTCLGLAKSGSTRFSVGTPLPFSLNDSTSITLRSVHRDLASSSVPRNNHIFWRKVWYSHVSFLNILHGFLKYVESR